MKSSQLNDDEREQTQRDTEQAGIISFNDVPTLRKLIAVFEDDLKKPDSKPGNSKRAGEGNKHVRS